MFKQITSLMLMTALIILACGTTIQARVSHDEIQPAANTSSNSDADKLANEKLRTAINKLVDDAKAGKLALAPRPQIQQRNSNHLSKGTKIAIGVGIAVAVVAIIVVANTGSGPSDPIRIF